jgi:hypothetical protein
MVIFAETDPLSAWHAFWQMLSSAFWPILVASLLYAFRSEIRTMFLAVSTRMKMGGALKIGNFELGAPTDAPNVSKITSEHPIPNYAVSDDNGERATDRTDHYKLTRGVMLVHRLTRSQREDQVFDILLYVIPHKTVLSGVAKVEYFFGNYWGNRVYSVTDRSRGFPVVVSAYGPMLCTAKVHFTDGETVMLYRYIDFEMGDLAHPAPKPKPEADGT